MPVCDPQEAKEVCDIQAGHLRDRLEKKELTLDEYAEAMAEVMAAGIDAVTDTGPLEPGDGVLFEQGIMRIYDAANDWLTREPHKMRQRASRLRQRGLIKRADRLEKRALRVEARG
jgi:hypothetical protein